MTHYAFFKPDVLETVKYAYDKTASEVQQGRVKVERVAAGRWADGGLFTTQRDASEVAMRAVTEEEAFTGIGTYSWDKSSQTGVVQVTFADGTSELPYGKEKLQDLALETYALWPCSRRGVADIMPAEMRATHIAVYEPFNGIGQHSCRSSATVLRKVGMTAEEVLDLTSDDVVTPPGKDSSPLSFPVISFFPRKDGRPRRSTSVASELRMRENFEKELADADFMLGLTNEGPAAQATGPT
ncbi:hypothetical protein PHMEG_00019364 [Phytophthora megakarya]|uniref:Uncharacterized protein n=1 Tax=Phytophthora megakarya TaxID=4795 RepID=A0A225VUB0_9STRA|nr:hypothetical protein PHMEG_00019364 [Phytophthora megakarya]